MAGPCATEWGTGRGVAIGSRFVLHDASAGVMSISKRIGAIVAAVLTTVLLAMFVILRMTQEATMMDRARESVHQSGEVLVRSITAAMGQGVTDVIPILDKMTGLPDLRELRVLPAGAIKAGGEALMDSMELRALQTKTGIASEESFKGEPVMRAVEPMIADEGCVACHDGKVGDPLAVVSLRFSMAKNQASIANERWLIIFTAVPTILLTFFVVMFMVNRQVVRDLSAGIARPEEACPRSSVQSTRDHAVRRDRATREYRSRIFRRACAGSSDPRMRSHRGTSLSRYR